MKMISTFLVDFYPIIFVVAGNENMRKILDEFEFWPGRTTDYGVSIYKTGKLMFQR